MGKILKLIKVGWDVKVNIWKCRMLDKTTDEYRLAIYYQNALNNLENTEGEVQTLILETRKLQNQFQGKKKIGDLLTAVIGFLDHLSLVRG